jgi:hypothetical protein
LLRQRTSPSTVCRGLEPAFHHHPRRVHPRRSFMRRSTRPRPSLTHRRQSPLRQHHSRHSRRSTSPLLLRRSTRPRRHLTLQPHRSRHCRQSASPPPLRRSTTRRRRLTLHRRPLPSSARSMPRRRSCPRPIGPWCTSERVTPVDSSPRTRLQRLRVTDRRHRRRQHRSWGQQQMASSDPPQPSTFVTSCICRWSCPSLEQAETLLLAGPGPQTPRRVQIAPIFARGRTNGPLPPPRLTTLWRRGTRPRAGRRATSCLQVPPLPSGRARRTRASIGPRHQAATPRRVRLARLRSADRVPTRATTRSTWTACSVARARRSSGSPLRAAWPSRSVQVRSGSSRTEIPPPSRPDRGSPQRRRTCSATRVRRAQVRSARWSRSRLRNSRRPIVPGPQSVRRSRSARP